MEKCSRNIKGQVLQMTVLSGASHVTVAGWRCGSDLVSEETIFSN